MQKTVYRTTASLDEWKVSIHQALSKSVSKELISKSFLDVSKKFGVCSHTLLAILRRRAQSVE